VRDRVVDGEDGEWDAERLRRGLERRRTFAAAAPAPIEEREATPEPVVERYADPVPFISCTSRTRRASFPDGGKNMCSRPTDGLSHQSKVVPFLRRECCQRLFARRRGRS